MHESDTQQYISNAYYLHIWVTFIRSDNGPKSRGATYMRGRNIVRVNGLQSLENGSHLWCNWYASVFLDMWEHKQCIISQKLKFSALIAWGIFWLVLIFFWLPWPASINMWNISPKLRMATNLWPTSWNNERLVEAATHTSSSMAAAITDGFFVTWKHVYQRGSCNVLEDSQICMKWPPVT